MSKAVSLRLNDDQMKRLEKAARLLNRSPAEAATYLLEAALRQREFAYVEIRETAVGDQAYIKGTRLQIWMIIRLLREFDGDIAATADYFSIPTIQIQAAVNYAEAFPEEINDVIADSYPTFEELKRRIPNLELIEVDASAS